MYVSLSRFALVPHKLTRRLDALVRVEMLKDQSLVRSLLLQVIPLLRGIETRVKVRAHAALTDRIGLDEVGRLHGPAVANGEGPFLDRVFQRLPHAARTVSRQKQNTAFSLLRT